MGGQFAEGRNPASGDLTHLEEDGECNAIQAESDSGRLSPSECAECGEPMEIDGSGVSHHLDNDGEIDYDADAEHTPYTEEDMRLAEENDDVAEQVADEQYCDYCEDEGHTFRSCPRRDDTPDQDVSDDFPMSVEYDNSYEDGD